MPTTKSAAKRLRSSAKRHVNNKARKSVVRTTEKKFLAQVTEQNPETAAVTLRKAVAALDKAAKTGAIPKNKANRKKSRLTAKLKVVKA